MEMFLLEFEMFLLEFLYSNLQHRTLDCGGKDELDSPEDL